MTPFPRQRDSRSTAARAAACLAIFSALLASLAGTRAAADDLLAERRAWVEQLSPAEKEDLRLRYERFLALPPDEQARLRELHQKLDRDSRCDELRAVMHRYSAWLKTLPPYRREELRELDHAERIRRIKQWMAEEARRNASLPSDEDVAGIKRWVAEYVEKNEDRFLQLVPEHRREQVAKLNPAFRRYVLARLVWWRWIFSKPGSPPISEEELASLRGHLSAPTRERLAQRPPAEQWALLAGWFRMAGHKFRDMAGFGGELPDDVEEEMARFFEHELTDEQRDRLLSLPAEEMRRELFRFYVMPGPSTGDGRPPWLPGRFSHGRRNPRDRPPEDGPEYPPHRRSGEPRE